jgi:hypothetical protein
MEAAIEEIRRTLDAQFERMAAIQAQFDHLAAALSVSSRSVRFPPDRRRSSAMKSRARKPPDKNVDPPCPACHSAQTERLPFSGEGPPPPFNACVGCGHVWRQLTPAAGK